MNKKGLAPLIVTIIIALIVGAGAGFVTYESLKIHKGPKPTSPSSTIQSSQSSSVTTITSPTLRQTHPGTNSIKPIYKKKWDGDSLSSYLLRSDNNGKTWNKIKIGRGIRYAVYQENPKIIYITIVRNSLRAESVDGSIEKSLNGGSSWIDISRGVIQQNPISKEFAQMVVGTKRVLRGFEKITVNSYNPNVVTVVVDTVDPQDNNLKKITFRSTDGGNTWIRLP